MIKNILSYIIRNESKFLLSIEKYDNWIDVVRGEGGK